MNQELNTEFDFQLEEALDLEVLSPEASSPANDVTPPPRALNELDIFLSNRKSSMNSAWDSRLIFDLALENESLDELLVRHDLTESQLRTMYQNPMFLKDIVDLRSDMQKEGLSLKLKARRLSEDYLSIMDKMIHSPLTTPGQKLDTIKQVNKLGDVEPKKDKDPLGGGQGSFNIQINIQ